MEKIEKIEKKNKLLAMIIRHDYTSEGVNFVTSDEYRSEERRVGKECRL